MKLSPENVVVIADTREQRPFDLSPLRMERGTLFEGDYALAAAPDLCRIERKTIPDLLLCIGKERRRFEVELQRLKAYAVRAVLIEGDYATLARGEYRAQIDPKAATHTIASWTARFCPFQFCGTRELAEDFARHVLWSTARRAWEQSERFRRALENAADAA